MRRRRNISNEPDAGFHLIDDRPIDDASGDTLEYKSISAAISKIVAQCDPPYTIGLFGSWGVGKTSITNMVIEHLSHNNGGIASVKLDVWKYEQDSLRRQLLLEILKQLKDAKVIEPAYSPNERLDKTVSRTTMERRSFHWPTFLTDVFLYCLILAIALILWRIPSATKQPLSSFLTGLTGGSIILLVGNFFKSLLEHIPLAYHTTERTETQNRIEDPQGFEAEFKRLLSSCSADRVLLVVDNLDRCSMQRCKELLSTLTTFLEPDSEKCVFLLTCDENALKKHIDGSSGGDADEYLRKFFNVVIRVPQPISSDLQVYTRRIVESTKIKDFECTSDLTSVIISGYRRNPRQIKQFVNSLVAAYLIARERETDEEDTKALPEGAVTQNPAFLAKTLIIQDRWPAYYGQFQHDPTILNDLPVSDETKLYPGLQVFLEATQWIRASNPQDFINLKRSETDRRLRGTDTILREALEEGDASKVLDIAKKLNDSNVSTSDIESFVVETYERTSSQQTQVNILKVLSSMTRQLNIQLTPDFCDSVSAWLLNGFSARLSIVPADLTFAVVRLANRAGKQRLLHEIGQEIGSMETDEDAALMLCNVAFLVEARNSKEFLATHGIDIPSLVLWWKTWRLAYLEELVVDQDWCQQIAGAEDRKVPKFLLSTITLELILKQSTDGLAKQQFDLTCNIINALASAEPRVSEDFLEHLHTIAANQNSLSAMQRQIILKLIGQSLERVSVLPSPDPARQDMAVQTVQDLITGMSDADILQIACTAMTYLDEGATESTKQNATRVAQQFLNQGSSVARLSFLQELNTQQWTWLVGNARDLLLGHSSETQEMFDLLWKFRTDESEIGLVESSLANSHYAWLEKANSDSPIRNRASATTQILGRLSAVVIPEQTGLVALVNDLACGDDGANQKKLADNLKEALCSTSLERQTMAAQGIRDASRYMTGILMNDVVTPSLQWLDSKIASDPTNAPGYESVSPILEAAARFAKQLSGGQQLNILGILFERYLRTSSDPIVITNVFSTVASFNFKKKALKGYQEGVETRMQTETNENIKAALQEGLQKLGLNQPDQKAADR